MPDVLEQQLAVVGAHLGGVDAEPVEQVERLAEQRAARDGDRAGSFIAAMRRRSSPASAMCSRSTSSAKPTAGSGAAEAPEQVVVAPAAAERRRRAPGRRPRTPRPCSSRGSRTRPRSKIDALGDVAASSSSWHRAQPVDGVADRPGERLEHLGAAAQLRHAQQQLGVVAAQAERCDLALEPDEVAA